MKPMRTSSNAIVKAAVCAAIMFCMSGCYETEHPVGGPGTALSDTRVVGSWHKVRETAARPATMEIRDLGSNELGVHYFDPVHGEINVTALIHDLDGVRYVTARGLGGRADTPGYGLFSYEFEDGKLKLLVLRATLPEFRSQDELRAFLRANADKPHLLFEGPMYFERGAAAE